MTVDDSLAAFIQLSQSNAEWWHQRRVQLRNSCAAAGVMLFIAYDGLHQLGEAVWLVMLCLLLAGPALTVAAIRLWATRRGTHPAAAPPLASDADYVHSCQGRLAQMETRNVRVERGLFALESLLGWMLLAWVVAGSVAPPEGTAVPLLAMTLLLATGLILAEGRRRQLMRVMQVARVELQLASTMERKARGKSAK